MFRRGKVFIFDRLFICACFTTCLKLWMDLWNRSQFQCLSWELSQGLVTWLRVARPNPAGSGKFLGLLPWTVNTQTHWNTKCKRHKHVHTNKSIQNLTWDNGKTFFDSDTKRKRSSFGWKSWNQMDKISPQISSANNSNLVSVCPFPGWTVCNSHLDFSQFSFGFLWSAALQFPLQFFDPVPKRLKKPSLTKGVH